MDGQIFHNRNPCGFTKMSRGEGDGLGKNIDFFGALDSIRRYHFVLLRGKILVLIPVAV